MSGSEEIGETLRRFQQRSISAPVALMELLIATEDLEATRAVVRTSEQPELLEMLETHREGCVRIVQMLRTGLDSSAPAPDVEAGIAFCRRLFDSSVTQSEACSVALYSLDSPELLAKATEEVVALLERWGLLDMGGDALDLGCGIGRFAEALQGRLASVVGIDVSERMVEAARRRCAGIPNTRFLQTDGRDLQQFQDHSFDLVLAVDSFPYVHQSGAALVARYFEETARVLKANGSFALLNLSYGRARETDVAEVESLARAHGFGVRSAGEEPFRLWNGRAFLLQRSVPSARAR